MATAMDATRLALLAAISAEPDEDTPRLILADHLQEQAESAPSEKCPKCQGDGWKFTGPTGLPRCPRCHNSSQNAIPEGSPDSRRCASCKVVWVPEMCGDCKGFGTVRDTSDADRAELIRVQYQLSLIWGYDPSGTSPDFAPLLARESAILKANPEWCKATCPDCRGYGYRMERESPQHEEGWKTRCHLCGGTGDLFKRVQSADDTRFDRPVTFDRGLPITEAALAECVQTEQGWPRGEPGVTRPSLWLLALAHTTDVVGVRLTDRQPNEWDGSFSWHDDSRDMRAVQHSECYLPVAIYDKIQWEFDHPAGTSSLKTAEAANLAAAYGVMAWARNYKENPK